MNGQFLLRSVLLGIALAMDAFSVSVADGISNPQMKKRTAVFTAGVFGFFQFFMPLLGWLFVTRLTSLFQVLEEVVPYLAFAILAFLGVKMIVEGLVAVFKEPKRKLPEEPLPKEMAPAGEGKPEREKSPWLLLLQALATSLDALSVGLTTASYPLWMAAVSAGIIGLITFGLCIGGILAGEQLGKRFLHQSGIVAGAILVIIAFRILLI